MTLLSDLLAKQDFSGEVEKLGQDLRAQFELPPVAQLGLVVLDLRSIPPILQRYRIPDLYLLKGSPVLWREQGAERKVSGRIGLTAYAGYELEFIEPTRGSDFYTGAVDADGGIAVHHLGLRCRDVDAWARKLEAAGMALLVRGKLEVGPLQAEFAYMDTIKRAGVILEFIEWKLFGRSFIPKPESWRRETLDRLFTHRKT